MSAAIILVCILLIMSNSKQSAEINFKEGTVVSKKFVEEHTKNTRHCDTFTGKVLLCSTRPTHYDDYWEVVITKEKNGEPVSRGIEVSEDQYNSLNEGDYFNSEPDRQ